MRHYRDPLWWLGIIYGNGNPSYMIPFPKDWHTTLFIFGVILIVCAIGAL